MALDTTRIVHRLDLAEILADRKKYDLARAQLDTIATMPEREYLDDRRKAAAAELLQKAGATQYVSGPAARAYISDERFRNAGIDVIWKDYSGYPEYPQLHGPFSHSVSILDLLFHTGPQAAWHIWGWRTRRQSEAAA